MGYRNYAPANGFIVAKDGNGDFSTIATALTAATSGTTIFIRPGTYTENLTLKAGVNLCAFDSDSGINGGTNTSANVIIIGKCTMTTAGTVTISGIQLQTNSDYFLAITGSAASIVNLVNCYLNAVNNTGISYSSSSSSSQLNISYCMGNIGTTGITPFLCTSSGTLNIYYTTWLNSGGATTTSTVNTTIFNCWYTFLNTPITITSVSTTISHSWFTCTNATCLTLVTSGTTTCTHCAFVSGTATAISAGSGTTIGLNLCEVSSTNTNALTGSGTINSYGILFSNTSFKNNATTSGGGAMTGLTQGTAPTAGFLGEQIISVIAQASAVSLPVSNNVYNVTSIALTPGIWDITLLAIFQPPGTTLTAYIAIIGTSNSDAGTVGNTRVGITTNTIGNDGIVVPAYRVTLASSTTYYFNASSQFTGTSPSCFGRISAVRVG